MGRARGILTDSFCSLHLGKPLARTLGQSLGRHTALKDGLARTIAYFDRLLSDQKLRAQLVGELSA
jgi:hypothetical protein